MTTPYSDSVSAKADGTGNAVFNFRPAQAKHVIQCAVTVDGATSSATSKATVGIAGGVGRPWGSWTGANASQGLQFIAPEILSLVTTGLTAGAEYTAFLEGVDYNTDSDFVPYMSPSQPYSTTVAGGSLNFQHNGVPVAAEPAIDFEDGGGNTWTLADDPGANRVKVTASVASSGALTSALGAPVALPPGALTKVFDSPSLGTGTWLVMWQALVFNIGNFIVEMQVRVDTATAVLTGGTAGGIDALGGGGMVSGVLIAVVTVAGTLELVGLGNQGSGNAEVQSTSDGTAAFPNATTFTAVKLA